MAIGNGFETTRVRLDPVAGPAPPHARPCSTASTSRPRPTPLVRSPAPGRAGHGGHRPGPAGPGGRATGRAGARRAHRLAAPGRGDAPHGRAEPLRRATARPSCSSATASTRSSTSPTRPRCCATAGWPAPSTGDEITENRLIELIAGRALDRVFPAMPAVTTDEVALEVKRPDRRAAARRRASSCSKGEVLGIAGLLGSGRSELLKMVFGAYPIRSGSISIDGKPVALPPHRRGHGRRRRLRARGPRQRGRRSPT